MEKIVEVVEEASDKLTQETYSFSFKRDEKSTSAELIGYTKQTRKIVKTVYSVVGTWDISGKGSLQVKPAFNMKILMKARNQVS